ncbi:MAG TPA: hypothetical protein VIM07_13620 [Chitinophagaceae bacterium]
MKNNYLSLFVFIIVGFTSCSKEYTGDSFDTSTSLAPYVEIATKTAQTVKQGASFSVSVQMRTALTENVTVNYTVTGTSATIQGSIVIPRNTLKATSIVTIPTGVVVAPATSVVAQFKIVSAIRGSESLRIGYKDPTKEVITITITP